MGMTLKLSSLLRLSHMHLSGICTSHSVARSLHDLVLLTSIVIHQSIVSTAPENSGDFDFLSSKTLPKLNTAGIVSWLNRHRFPLQRVMFSLH